MKSTFNRRQFLGLLAAAGFAPLLRAQISSSQEYWVSAQGSQPNQFGLSSYNPSAKKITTGLSGFRGHGAAQHPLRPASVLMFSRRPGNQAIDVNIQNGNINNQFKTRNDRCFTGHGCFSQDARYLFTGEVDAHTGAGKIAVRDSETYQQLDEFDSYGIGPHQFMLMPDGQRLVIANGGILTRAKTGRKKLNLDNMTSSLTYVDAHNGHLDAQYFVAEPKASIRHLDVAHDGSVAIAMQVQREAMTHNKTVPLAAIHKPGREIQLLDQPELLIQNMNDYAGSVAVNNKTRIAGFTSPKGNLAAFWHIDSGILAGYHQLVDVCGLTVSADQSHFIISNSFGNLRILDSATLKENRAARKQFANTQWDNHMITVTL